jgi:uncharacterized protein (TIGR02145 family)
MNTVTDIDGNVYHTVKIGSQWWMVENLKTSRFRDGSAITEIQDKTKRRNAYKSEKAAWSYYDNNAQNNPTYGKLYNWYGVADPRSLCPLGWHVPSDEEFQLLVDYLGGPDMAGGKMKAQTLWHRPNSGADNSSGFTALPAGFRYLDGPFYPLGHDGAFWSSTAYYPDNAWYRYLVYNSSCVYRSFNHKVGGLSVRCVRD